MIWLTQSNHVWNIAFSCSLINWINLVDFFFFLPFKNYFRRYRCNFLNRFNGNLPWNKSFVVVLTYSDLLVSMIITNLVTYPKNKKDYQLLISINFKFIFNYISNFTIYHHTIITNSKLHMCCAKHSNDLNKFNLNSVNQFVY